MPVVVLSLYSAAVYLHRPAPKVQVAQIDAAGNRWVRQEDGRLIEYFTCGSETGKPLYWAHGYGQSATFVPEYACELAVRYHVYVISVSMPGWGLSDSPPLAYKRDLSDWPADVDLVLQKEGVDELFLMGHSTGCLHAAAIAHRFPDRVLGILLNTPTAPYAIEKAFGGIAPATAFMKWALGKKYIGDLMAFAVASSAHETRVEATPDVAAAVRKMKALGGRYRQVAVDLVSDLDRAVVNSYRAFADTVHIIVEEPPFDLADFTNLTDRGVEFYITTAPDDTTNPPAMQLWWAQQIRGSKLWHFDAGWGHFHGFAPDNMERILRHVASAKRA